MRSPLLMAVIAIVLCQTPLQAGIIDQFHSVSGGFITSPSVDPPSTDDPNNDNVPFSENFGSYDLIFDFLQPIDVVYEVSDSSGVSEYDFIVSLRNQTGVAWQGISLELGFGSGVDFQRAALLGLDFDTPDRDSMVDYNGEAPDIHDPTLLVWMRTVNPDDQPSIDFSLDVSDLDPAFVPEAARTDGGYLLTVRHSMIVPEPGSGLLLLASLGGLTFRKRSAPGGVKGNPRTI